MNAIKKKFIILTSQTRSLSSVHKISQDIILNYQQLLCNEKVVTFSLSDEHPIDNDILNLIQSDTQSTIIAVHPEIIRLKSFTLLLGYIKSSDEIIIHLYGDFLRQAPRFSFSAKLLKGKKIKFVTPSRAYADLISRCFEGPSCVSVIPFPVENKEIDSHLELKELRKKFNIDDHLVFLYAGRITRQKNVAQLLKVFNEESKKQKMKLFIIGQIDEVEFSTVGTNDIFGSVFKSIEPFMGNENIIFIDHLENGLADYYQLADYFISLSCYHDEDFGRAPVEALLNGCQLILTRWGGYKDLEENFPRLVRGFPVALNNGDLVIKMEAPFSHLISKKNRVGLAEDFFKVGKIFSNENFKENIAQLIDRPVNAFAGMSIEYEMLARLEKKYFYNFEGNLDDRIYFRFYKNFGLEA